MRSIAVLAAGLILTACASEGATNIQAWGLGAGVQDHGNVDAQAFVGGAGASVSHVPYINKKTGQQYFSTDPCMGAEAPATEMTVNGTVNNGGAIGSPLGLSAASSTATGEVGKIDALARLQVAATSSHDIFEDYANCRADRANVPVVAPASSPPR